MPALQGERGSRTGRNGSREAFKALTMKLTIRSTVLHALGVPALTSVESRHFG